jgi:hypothetical protein
MLCAINSVKLITGWCNWNASVIKKSTQSNTMKNLSKTILTVVAVGMLSCGLFSQQAQAVAINGFINFAGVTVYNTKSLVTATEVMKWNSSLVLEGATTGDFATFTTNLEHVTMGKPWMFNPSTPKLGLWKVGGFTFDLSSSTIVSQSAFFLNITGTGMVSGNGFDPTPGDWSFTSTDSNGKIRSSFGFQSDTAAVPDGGATAALLGLALAGVGVLRRKFKAA